MPTYISLIQFTTQGLETIDESPKRAEAFTVAAEKMGVSVRKIFWTTGGYDGILSIDAPDDASAAAAILALSRDGNVKTQMLRAFDQSEFQELLDSLP
jgi:uncharacterized protein with GYD domain